MAPKARLSAVEKREGLRMELHMDVCCWVGLLKAGGRDVCLLGQKPGITSKLRAGR